MKSLAFMLVGLIGAGAQAAQVTITNPSEATEYRDAPVRLEAKLPSPFDGSRIRVTEDGKVTPHQVEVRRGGLDTVHEGDVWICTTLAPHQSRTFEVTVGEAPAPKFEPKVKLKREGDDYVLDNGLIAIRVPAHAPQPRELPGPINAVRVDGRWVGKSEWSVSPVSNGFQSRVLGDGTVFAAVELDYFFIDPSYGGAVPFATVTVRMNPNEPVVHVEESHEMIEGDRWMFLLTDKFTPKQGIRRGWNRGSAKMDETPRRVDLIHDAAAGAAMARLGPTWTRGVEQSWFFAVTREKHLVGAFAARAGLWEWPQDNAIEVQRDDRGEGVLLSLPMWHGKRYWLLGAGDLSVAKDAEAIMERVAVHPLDTLVNP